MKAIIMAGGEGRRIRPLTCELPKPLVPVMNIPLMEHIINLLKSHGISEIAVTLMYLPQKIIEFFGNGQMFGVNLQYFTEDIPLGTAGSVKNAQDFLDDTFVVISGDCLTDLNITDAIKFHREKKSLATIVLTQVDVPLDYGVVITNKNNNITGFLEKPSWGEVFSDTINTGTYILEPRVLDYIEKNTKFDFSHHLFPTLLKNNEKLFGYTSNEYWLDIGDVNSYLKAHYDIFNKKINLECKLKEIKKGVFVGEGTIISPTAKIEGPCIIGNNCRIGNEVVIKTMSVIGNNNILEDCTFIQRGVVWNNNYIEYAAQIKGGIVCNKVNIKNHSSILEYSIVGDKSVVNERAIIKPNVRIWPEKIIDPLATVDRNIIWGTRHTRTIFGENGVSGIINVDINPEFATRLGAAYGSTVEKGIKVVVSSTTSNSARMFKHAFISGILSVGVEVFNLSSLLTPIARHAINFLSVEGGIHIKLSNDNPNKLSVDFMASKGASISRVMERQIENAFYREDFKRCSGDEISRLNNITDFKNYYIRAILNDVNVQIVKEKNIKVCVFSPSDFVSSIVVPMLTDLGCKVASFSSTSLNKEVEVIEIIKNNSADFAAIIDGNGENLALCDKNGRFVEGNLFLTLTSLILLRSEKNVKLVVPLTAPSIIETLAKKYDAEVVRTKSSTQAVMQQMLYHDMANDNASTTQFLLNFDAPASLVKIIEFLCSENTSLAELIDEIPDFHIAHNKIFCPWELKGKVMRSLIKIDSAEKIELLDGVKYIYENGWCLVLPDADLPLFRVYSEGTSEEVADNNSLKYLNIIKEIIGNSDN